MHFGSKIVTAFLALRLNWSFNARMFDAEYAPVERTLVLKSGKIRVNVCLKFVLTWLFLNVRHRHYA